MRPKPTVDTQEHTPLRCPQCNSDAVTWHDGLLGYEAIRCRACGQETDANSDALRAAISQAEGAK